MRIVSYLAVVYVICLAGASRAQQVLDQSQEVYDAGTSARTLPGYTVWQSFKAGRSGRLTQIDMGFFNNMSGYAELDIYAGDGTAGSIIQSLTVPVAAVNGGVSWNSWKVNVASVDGNMYTFNITPDAATLPDPYGVCVGFSNPYPNGIMGLNDPSGTYRTSMDVCFRTWVTVPEPASLAGVGGALLVLGLRRRR